MKEVVNGIEREFPGVGCRVLLDATAEIRKLRQEAFAIAGGSICGVGDPSTTVDQIWAGLTQYMHGMVIDDQSLRAWMFSYDGAFFLIGKSLRKANERMPLSDINAIIDSLGSDQVIKIGTELMRILFPELRPDVVAPESAPVEVPPAE